MKSSRNTIVRQSLALAILAVLLMGCGPVPGSGGNPTAPRIAPADGSSPKPTVARPAQSPIEQVADYVVITFDGAAIRLKPSDGSDLVATARRGEIFERISVAGDWVEIGMFSGEWRYVRLSQTAPIAYKPATALTMERRKQVFRALLGAEDRAETEASARIPNRLVMEQIMLNRILNDRYKLETMRAFGLQPPEYRAIKLEGVREGWYK